MPILNFKERFVPHIESRRKKHTIRAKRKYPCKVGDKLYLYTGLRTKKAKKISVEECSMVQDIKFDTPYPDAEVILPWDVTVTIDGIGLGADEMETLAYHDGFKDFAEMVSFWNGRLPFEGDIIHWK